MRLSHAWEENAGGAGAASIRSAGTETVTRVMDGHALLVAGLVRPAPPMAGVAARYAEIVVLLRPIVVDTGAFGAGGSRR